MVSTFMAGIMSPLAVIVERPHLLWLMLLSAVLVLLQNILAAPPEELLAHAGASSMGSSMASDSAADTFEALRRGQ
jgi:hypothetical protein